MIWVYRLLFLPGLLVMLPAYLVRMFRRGGYRTQFGNRFGRMPPLPPRGERRRAWVHAVSVGETLAIAPVVHELYRRGVEVFFTTTTTTAFAVARDRLAAETIGIGYFPLDFLPFTRAAWRRVQPDLVVLTEGEFWPEFLRCAGKKGTPVVSVNARLSDRSFGRLRRVPWLARWWAGGVDRLLASSRQDADRFRALGVSEERIVLTGNIKLDIDIPRLSSDELAGLRRELGLGAELVLLGSATWPGEEIVLLQTLREAREAGIDVSLLIVPRHAERRHELAALLESAGVRWHQRTRGAATESVDVCLADTTGELRMLTQVADLVFIGKSLPPYPDGQTPVEAAILGKPMLFGPGMSAFPEIVKGLLEYGAAIEVPDGDALQREILALLGDETKRKAMGEAALRWHSANRGALAATMREIDRLLPGKA